MIKFVKDLFIEALSKDPSQKNTSRTVPHGFYSYVTPKETKNPSFIHQNKALYKKIDPDTDLLKNSKLLDLLSGNKIPENSLPYSMNYGGHQFGHWAGQLGDGRAIHLGAVKLENSLWQLQLKGAGPTPYSRNADGLAVLRSSVREYLCSEAMQALGVPTTRALSLSLTGDLVLRDVLYNGNTAYEAGAVIARMAPCFIRFGSFELPANRGQINALEELTKATIKYHFPEIKTTGKEAYLEFFEIVCTRTAALIVEWQRVGFVHGVLNTDNMSILGLTIDYGPYGWLEPYDPNWTPNTTDAKESRYCFGNQSKVSLWNLYQLANAIYPLVEEAAPLEKILDLYKAHFEKGYCQMMCKKLGIKLREEHQKEKQEVLKLIATLEEVLVLTETDMTLFFRLLSSFNSKAFLAMDKKSPIASIFGPILIAFYTPEALVGIIKESWVTWITDYAKLLEKQGINAQLRLKNMNAVNPKYVLRNYMAQMAIEKAEKGDYSLVSELYELLQFPYEEQPSFENWFAKRPEWARNKIGCSALSCSS